MSSSGAAPAKAKGLWPLFRAAAYLTGRGVTFGAPLLPQAAVAEKTYSIAVALVRGDGVAAVDKTLDVIADGSLDHVLVTPMVEAADSPARLLAEATDKLRMGGHLVLLVRLGNVHPGITTFTREGIETLVGACHKWQCKGRWEQDGLYLIVLKKVEGRRGILPEVPRAARRACIARYGAIGDAIMMTPLIRRLAEDGYEVTLNVSPYCAAVFENNPYVSNILLQERDLVPNHTLSEYWATWAGEYDKYINLSESIEGDLLVIEGRPNFFTTKSWRHERGNRNYYDYTMRRGGYPEALGTRGELYFTRAEERDASRMFAPWAGKFTVVWALNGSSKHKVYPLMEPTLVEWLREHRDAQVITVGDYTARLLEFEHPQLIPRAGQWTIRQSMIATKYADLVVGPETAITNAAGCFPTPKIVLLSHSTGENLTKYFENDYSLTPDTTLAPCYPCHQLHYTAESCPTGEMKDTASGELLGTAPICALAISPQRLMAQMDVVYGKWKANGDR